jgi:signal transduction histidine kinase
MTVQSSAVMVPREEWQTLIHDLRSPLATVSTYAQLLRRRAGQDLNESLGHIQEAAARLDRLVDQLAAAPDASRRSRSRMLDLVPLVRELAAQSAPATASRIGVLTKTPELIGTWDVTAVERVLGNLIENAVKYSPAQQPIVISLAQCGNWAEIRVSDAGIGIPPEDLPRVFERGHRATNVGAARGDGLGLATVRLLVTLMAGQVELDSTLGVGTTVVVRLPRGKENLS